jgi:hypothetical protein
VMPLEVEIPSLRVLVDSVLEEVEWEKVRYEQLNLISEKRIATICHHQLYQRRMTESWLEGPTSRVPWRRPCAKENIAFIKRRSE